MATQIADTTANAMLDAVETDVGTSPVLTFRTGTKPANVAAVPGGTVVGTLNLPSDWMSAASGRTKAKSGTWEDTSADADGTITYYLISTSGAVRKIMGICSDAWKPSKVYAAGRYVHNGGNVYICTSGGTSAGSGGPTGTGSGIADGTAVWQFVQTGTDMELANCEVNATQPIVVNTYTLSITNG